MPGTAIPGSAMGTHRRDILNVTELEKRSGSRRSQ
jgi:hypothetical protein